MRDESRHSIRLQPLPRAQAGLRPLPRVERLRTAYTGDDGDRVAAELARRLRPRPKPWCPPPAA